MVNVVVFLSIFILFQFSIIIVIPLALVGHLAWVVRKVDNAIHWINHYPVDSVVCFVNTYLLDSDLSGG